MNFHVNLKKTIFVRLPSLASAARCGPHPPRYSSVGHDCSSPRIPGIPLHMGFAWESRMETQICQKMGMGRVHVTVGLATFSRVQNSHRSTRCSSSITSICPGFVEQLVPTVAQQLTKISTDTARRAVHLR